jgi:hypothetical protein
LEPEAGGAQIRKEQNSLSFKSQGVKESRRLGGGERGITGALRTPGLAASSGVRQRRIFLDLNAMVQVKAGGVVSKILSVGTLSLIAPLWIPPEMSKDRGDYSFHLSGFP